GARADRCHRRLSARERAAARSSSCRTRKARRSGRYASAALRAARRRPTPTGWCRTAADQRCRVPVRRAANRESVFPLQCACSFALILFAWRADLFLLASRERKRPEYGDRLLRSLTLPARQSTVAGSPSIVSGAPTTSR